MIAVIDHVQGIDRLVFAREHGVEGFAAGKANDVIVVSLNPDVRARANEHGFRCHPDVVVARVSTTSRRRAATTLARAKSRALRRPWVVRLTRKYFTVFNVTYHGLLSVLRGPANAEADQIATALAEITAERATDRFVIDGAVGALALHAFGLEGAEVVLL